LEILRLVDDQYGATASSVLLLYMGHEATIQVARVGRSHLESERFRDPGQQGAETGMSVGDETNVQTCTQAVVRVFQEVTHDGRLAAAHFAGYHGKAGGL
jgi:hypothetical protein